nr:uncharacterized protein LOC109118840 [Solanum lycopersicum]
MTGESIHQSSSTVSTATVAKIRPIHDPSSVYYLHPSEGPSNSLTKYLLKGDNFDVWEQAICHALEGRSKIGFLYENEFPKPTNDLELDAWKANNSIICSWIFNSADETIQPSLVAHKIAHELWTDIKARYRGTNAPKSWQLKSDLQTLRQKGQSVVSYYNQFITIWNQLYGSIDPTCGCICPAAAKMRLRFEEEKTQAFLLGLDDAQFGATRSQILGTQPLPVLNEAYYLVSQEERHKSIVRNRDDQTDGLAFAAENQPTQTPKYKCTHCGKTDHSAERCFLLIGFPSGGRRGRGGGRGGRSGRGSPSGREQSAGRGGGLAAHADSSTAPTATIGSNQGTTILGLSAEQMTQLLHMLDTPTQSANHTGTVHALSPDWLIDSGASHHMTGNFLSLYDITSVPECSIGLPDGTRVVANSCGSVQISDNLTLHNDRVLTTEIGRGTARNGVYVFQSQAFVYRGFLAAISTTDIPRSFRDAVKLANWREAMQIEIRALENNQTWVLTDLPAGRRALGCQWVYKTKYHADGSKERDKARRLFWVIIKNLAQITRILLLQLPEWELYEFFCQLPLPRIGKFTNWM